MEFFANLFFATLALFFVVLIGLFIGFIIRIVVDEIRNRKIEKMQYADKTPDKTIEFAILGGTGSISFYFYCTNDCDIRCNLSVVANTIDSTVKREFEKRLEKNNFKFEHYGAKKMSKDLDIDRVRSEVDAIIDDWSDF